MNGQNVAPLSSKPVEEVRSFVDQAFVSLEGKSWRPLSGEQLPLALNSGDWLRTQDDRAEFYYYGAGAEKISCFCSLSLPQKKARLFIDLVFFAEQYLRFGLKLVQVSRLLDR